MKHRLFTVLLSCLVLGVLAGAASGEPFKMKTVLDEPGISQETLAKLIADGQLLIVRENKAGRLKLITSGILIDRPPEVVYKTAIDYANYDKFMPSTKKAEIVADNGDSKDVLYEIQFKFLIFKFTVEYVLRTWFEPNEKITWNLLSCKRNKIAKTFGSWQLIPVNGGTQTAAFYSVYSDISNAVIGLKTIFKKEPSMEVAINASTCILVLKALKNRSENPNWVQKK